MLHMKVVMLSFDVGRVSARQQVCLKMCSVVAMKKSQSICLDLTTKLTYMYLYWQVCVVSMKCCLLSVFQISSRLPHSCIMNCSFCLSVCLSVCLSLWNLAV